MHVFITLRQTYFIKHSMLENKIFFIKKRKDSELIKDMKEISKTIFFLNQTFYLLNVWSSSSFLAHCFSLCSMWMSFQIIMKESTEPVQEISSLMDFKKKKSVSNIIFYQNQNKSEICQIPLWSNNSAVLSKNEQAYSQYSNLNQPRLVLFPHVNKKRYLQKMMTSLATSG